MAAVAYLDRRDTLNRLARVMVTGLTATGWLAVLDPIVVREISDEDLARMVGGSIGTPLFPDVGLYPWPGLYPNGLLPVPPITTTPGAFGSGGFGSGPFGG